MNSKSRTKTSRNVWWMSLREDSKDQSSKPWRTSVPPHDHSKESMPSRRLCILESPTPKKKATMSRSSSSEHLNTAAKSPQLPYKQAKKHLTSHWTTLKSQWKMCVEISWSTNKYLYLNPALHRRRHQPTYQIADQRVVSGNGGRRWRLRHGRGRWLSVCDVNANQTLN